jgi:acetaldehyde dehydrogenase (acetylating)
MEYALKKPDFRLLATPMGTLGSVGITTGLMPAMTLGPGGIGGAISGDNITVTHLLNIKRLAYPIKAAPAEALVGGAPTPAAASRRLSAEELQAIVRAVVEEVVRQGR